MKRIIIISVAVSAVFTTICIGAGMGEFQKSEVRLPEPKLSGQVSLEQAIALRRSVRQFISQPLDIGQISQLTWAAQGITDTRRGFRAAPSAGAIYPIKLYLALPDGLFVYQPAAHSLQRVSAPDIRRLLSQAALGQRPVADAACDIIITGSERKIAAKYGRRARQYMLLEAGHIAQNIQLQAVSLNLGSVPIGAFDTEQVHRVCTLPADLEPLYIISVGRPLKTARIKTMEEKMTETKTKKAVLIIAGSNFRDEELFETQAELKQAGIETTLASSKTGSITGMLGGRAQATIVIGDINVDDYEAIVFVGGSGAAEYFDDRIALKIARQAAEKKKILAAICIAPTVLANAGVLDGIKATCFSSQSGSLRKAGAVYTGSAVEKDALIITASGPNAAGEFGKAIADALAE